MWLQKSPIDYSKWICRATHSPFSHGDLVLSDGTLLGASDNKFAPVIQGNARGVAIRPPNYQRFHIRRDARIHTDADRAKAFEDYCRKQIGKPFDGSALKPGVFLSGDFSNRDWRTEEAWYCFELMARATEEAHLFGYKLANIKNRVSAADYLLMIGPRLDFDAFMKPIPTLQMAPWEM
jgi:hypothetical protein